MDVASVAYGAVMGASGIGLAWSLRGASLVLRSWLMEPAYRVHGALEARVARLEHGPGEPVETLSEAARDATFRYLRAIHESFDLSARHEGMGSECRRPCLVDESTSEQGPLVPCYRCAAQNVRETLYALRWLT